METNQTEFISNKIFSIVYLVIAAVMGVAVPVILAIGIKLQSISPKILYVAIYHAILCSIISLIAKKKSGF